jgi:hypothetical protein
VLELWHDNRRAADLPLEKADFARAVEATFFEALRRGEFLGYAPPLAAARVEPCLKDAGPSSPAFEVVLPTPAGQEVRQRFDADYFQTMARRTGARLVLAGRLPGDAVLEYRLSAFADEAPAVARRGLKIELESEGVEVPITGAVGAGGPAEAWDAPAADDFPVRIARHVIEESVAEARRTPDREVGGVLLGHLRRDEGGLYLEVTCVVPAEETRASAVSVTFTHATWARVREVCGWRGEGELIVGWVHSHPFRLCAECPVPVPPECQAKVLFYSTDDEFLMELTFGRPFMVGLLAAVEPKLEATFGRPPVKLFGWKGGRIVPRGFEVTE